MDIVYVPTFLTELPDVEIFRRLEVFTNLCIKYTSKMNCGVDSSVKTIQAILMHPPLSGMPVMNGVLDLLKDVMFAYQAVKLTGSQDECSQDPVLQQGSYTKFKMFPSQVKSEVKTLHKALNAAIQEHKAVIRKLTDAHQVYVQQNERLQFLARQNNDRQRTSEETSDAPKRQRRDTSGKVDKNSLKLQKALEKQKDATMKAFVRRMVFTKRERQLRDVKLKQIERKLSHMIQDRMTEALDLGLQHLVEFGRQFAFPQAEMDQLDQFDVDFVASKIYKQMSTRYVFPTIESYNQGTTIPECRFEIPDLSAQNKHDIRLGKSESCVDLLHEAPSELRREELYVWACCNTGSTGAKSKTDDLILRLDKGQKVKQKFCSADGKLGFGWKRRISCGVKTYGFYPTHAVHLVP